MKLSRAFLLHWFKHFIITAVFSSACALAKPFIVGTQLLPLFCTHTSLAASKFSRGYFCPHPQPGFRGRIPWRRNNSVSCFDEHSGSWLCSEWAVAFSYSTSYATNNPSEHQGLTSSLQLWRSYFWSWTPHIDSSCIWNRLNWAPHFLFAQKISHLEYWVTGKGFFWWVPEMVQLIEDRSLPWLEVWYIPLQSKEMAYSN